MKKIIALFLLVGGTTLIGCGDDDSGTITPDYNRKEMLTDLAENYIIPNYERLNNAVGEMEQSIGAFINDPNTTTLSDARAKFLNAYTSWQKVSFLSFGPAFDETLAGSLNSFPADYISIDNDIASGNTSADSPDFNALSGLDEKGFPAIDYLLYNPATDEEVIAYYTTDQDAANRKAYLTTVITDIKTRTSNVLTNWSAAGGNYKAQFINSDGTDVGSSLGLMINALNLHVESRLRDDKIGIPLGKRSQGITIPANVEALYSEKSTKLAFDNIKGLYDFFLGIGPDTDGQGLNDYLSAINASYNNGLLVTAITDQFITAIQAVQDIPSPYSETVDTNPAPAEAAHTELQKLTILLKADMSSALGVVITYQDNDGD